MHYKALLISIIVLCVAATAAKAQIGWTPAQMQKRYGVSVAIPQTDRLSEASYSFSPDAFPLMAQLGISQFSVTFLDGKVVSVVIPATKLSENQMASIGLFIIDAKATKKDLDWNLAAYEKHILRFDCKGYYCIYSDGNLVIGPGTFTPLSKTLQDEWAKISKGEQDSIQQELQGKK